MNISFYTRDWHYTHPTSEDECVEMASVFLESGPIAIDVETVSLLDRTPIGFSISPDRWCAFYYTLFPAISPHIPWKLLEDTSRLKIFHNLMFDLDVMDDIVPVNLFDTCLAASWVGLPLALDQFSNLMGIEDKKSIADILPKGKTMLDIPLWKVAEKCCQDSITTYRLWEKIQDDIDPTYMDWEMRLVPILLRMNNRGVKLDQELLHILKNKYETEVKYYRGVCDGLGFSPSSGRQIGYVLADRGNVLPLTKGKKQLKTNDETLKACKDPLAKLILNFKYANSMLSKGINPILNKERAYTKYGLLSTTGRTTSSGAKLPGHINIQQQFAKDSRREIRHVFLPDSGIWTDADDSQIELRVIAYMSQDPNMIRVFENYDRWLAEGTNRPRTPEEDIHLLTAKVTGASRKISKNLNYALSYGGNDTTIASYADIPIEVAARFRALLLDTFPIAFRWLEEQQAIGLREGVVESLYGRKFYVEELAKDMSECMRFAVNYPIQGTASEIFKRQLVLVGEKNIDLAIEVHDEFIVDGYIPLDPELQWIAPFKTPLEVRYLSRWE